MQGGCQLGGERHEMWLASSSLTLNAGQNSPASNAAATLPLLLQRCQFDSVWAQAAATATRRSGCPTLFPRGPWPVQWQPVVVLLTRKRPTGGGTCAP